MKTNYILLILISFCFMACDDLLDIIPDNIATIDNAFTERASAERFLFTCYNYMPQHGLIESNPAITGGDEFFITTDFRSSAHAHSWYIAHGQQNSSDPTGPRCDFWRGANGASDLYQGISDCNIFLENIHKVPDMTQTEKDRWSAEVKFLKAYYHYWLVRMYGPIPIKSYNIPANGSKESFKVYRDPLDDCFQYIVNLLDTIINSHALPDKIMNEAQELGRITQGIAMATKAEVLVTAASPLFNGNTDYRNLRDNRGIEIFCPEKTEAEKLKRWEDAVTACQEAIDFLHTVSGNKLYRFNSLALTVSDQTRAKLTIRNAVTERWNSELVWGNSNSRIGQLQAQSIPRALEPGKEANSSVGGNLAVPIKVANQFYTKNGVPITEDKTWNYSKRYNLRKAVAADKYLIKEGYTTAELNFDREIRYYASMGFDGCVWFGQGGTDESNPYYVQAKAGQAAYRQGTAARNLTGIWPKKLVNYGSVVGASSGFTQVQYPFPVMRLANLYLLYAEALNETDNREEAIQWTDSIRFRAGLKGVKESWTNYSNNPGKFATKTGLREIIQQERLIELAFEAQRFWDLRRWKKAYAEQNKMLTGWNTEFSDETDYYTEVPVYYQTFSVRDYFWPIYDKEIYANNNIVQNYGW